jgi:zinc transporter 5/7
VSAIPHSHSHSHNHVHAHSHSHSPSFSPSKLGPGGQRGANASRAVRHERSGGSLHSYSMSDSLHDHGHINTSIGPRYGRSFANTDMSSRTHINGAKPAAGFNEKFTYDGSPEIAEMSGHESSPSVSGHSHKDHDHDYDHTHNDHDHDHDHSNYNHSHHDHKHHVHSHSATIKPSRFTLLILPYTESWPLLNTIMKEKDSRRIFYFMRYISFMPHLCIPI